MRLEAYSPTTDLDVTSDLQTGENKIEVSVQATGKPAAFAVRLVLEGATGDVTEIVTNESWRVSRQDAAGESARAATSRGSVSRELWGLDRRPATIDPFDNYEQWRQALGETAGNAPVFWTAPGFEITQLRTAQKNEGSWVSMAFDPEGRLTIAREDKGLLRMSLAADAKSVSQRRNDQRRTAQECRGLLYAHGSLYANANNSKGLYRLRDTTATGGWTTCACCASFPAAWATDGTTWPSGRTA